VVVAIRTNLLSRYELPAIGTNLVLMDVRENMSFIPASVNVKMVELSHKSVIRPRLGRILWV
jgi:hypothetical protein